MRHLSVAMKAQADKEPSLSPPYRLSSHSDGNGGEKSTRGLPKIPYASAFFAPYLGGGYGNPERRNGKITDVAKQGVPYK